jgi:AcrR family transcriptional regulator
MKRPRPTPAAVSACARTRQQLLQAAGEVFAEVGFRDATVRAICERAGANIAAVNYHFRDKEALYAEVLRYSQEQALKKYPPSLGVPAHAAPEKRLEAFVRSLLLRMFDEGPIAWHGKLMVREMIDPTAALGQLAKEKFRPLADELHTIVSQLLGCRRKDERVRLAGCSVVSQCVFYHHCRPVVNYLFPEQKFDARGIEQLTAHITRFSLAALKALACDRSRPPAKR